MKRLSLIFIILYLAWIVSVIFSHFGFNNIILFTYIILFQFFIPGAVLGASFGLFKRRLTEIILYSFIISYPIFLLASLPTLFFQIEWPFFIGINVVLYLLVLLIFFVKTRQDKTLEFKKPEPQELCVLALGILILLFYTYINYRNDATFYNQIVSTSLESKQVEHKTYNWKLTNDSELSEDPKPITAFSSESANNNTEFVTYVNTLVRIQEPLPILDNHPEFVEKVVSSNRFSSSPVVIDENPTLLVRAWRYSYNARGIIEMQNKLDGRETAVIVVHPWGIDDGQDYVTPKPAGVAFFCTPEKNSIYNKHVQEVLNPFLEYIRPYVALIGYSLRGEEDAVRKNLYRSPNNETVAMNNPSGTKKLREVLGNFNYNGQSLINTFQLTKGKEGFTYFEAFNGLDASDRYNNSGFWELPIPLASSLKISQEDIVFYDGEGEEKLIKYLKEKGIKNILLAGYATDKCVRSSTAGYDNLKSDFNVFIVGDATLATFPAQETPAMATAVALTNASLDNLITEIAWIEVIKK